MGEQSRKCYYSRGQTLYLGAVCSVYSLVAAGLVVWATLTLSFVAVTFAIGGIASSALMGWMIRAGAYVRGDRFIVRGYFWRRKFSWSEIDGFETEVDASRGYEQLFVRLVSGQRVRIDGAGSSMFARDAANNALQGLQHELAARRPDGERPAPVAPAPSGASAPDRRDGSLRSASPLTRRVDASVAVTVVALAFAQVIIDVNGHQSTLFSALCGLLLIGALVYRLRLRAHWNPRRS